LFRRHVLAAASLVCSCVIFRILEASLPQNTSTLLHITYKITATTIKRIVESKTPIISNSEPHPTTFVTPPLPFARRLIQLPRQMQRRDVQVQLTRDGLPLPQLIRSYETERHTISRSPCSAAAAMHVRVDAGRHIVVDDLRCK
jgi:hypothetical protein